ncbi:GNAT family N-acetyltransferase [Algoriphagus sp. D3-2-R+10]|uniref:GNAT family N-acetyltransferase n=1 Tax=Algoriphagus aurantiacus TaxID=3103948 RepID=UPI002B3B9A77|nr:GNAT family N-acetyltransferase [Algoriphagus sp. D3-2-R+10]MEB2777598.1 GNAT family N-acetyltransferase [Algoriphagus sp. D3-2-R+10]
MILYEIEKNLSLQDFMYVLDDSGLGKRRPMHDPEHLERMLRNSNLVIVAREGGDILGVLRALSDYSYRTFIADLAVISSRQGEGIGRGMLEFARSLAPEARLILFAAENAINFYQKLGFHLHERCYQLKPDERLH